MSMRFFRLKTIILTAGAAAAVLFFSGTDSNSGGETVPSATARESATGEKEKSTNTPSAEVIQSQDSPVKITSSEEPAASPYRAPAFVEAESDQDANEQEKSPEFLQDGKLDLNLAYLFEKDPAFLAANPRAASLIASGQKVVTEDLEIPQGFRFSFKVDPACSSRLESLFHMEDIDENAKALLEQGEPAFIAARARSGISGKELSDALRAENCVSAAGADVLEEVGAVSFRREPLTSNSRQRGYQIMRNAGLVSLFEEISYSTFGNTTVTLAVVDSGINTAHPDLRGVSSGARDDFGHGTMVAGTAAAPANGVGTMGSMPFHVRINSYKVNEPGKGTAYSSSVSNGIARAAAAGADVINVSWSGFTKGSYNTAIASAVRRGSLVTGSAGNYSLRVNTNVTIRGAISVGSLNGTDNGMASYSNFGRGVEIYTPGTYMTTNRFGRYTLASGTSFASPLVGGIGLMAKAYAKRHGRNISPAAIEDLIMRTSTWVSTRRGRVRKLQPLAVFRSLERSY